MGVLNSPRPNRLSQACDSVSTARIGVAVRHIAKEPFDLLGSALGKVFTLEPPNKAFGDGSASIQGLLR